MCGTENTEAFVFEAMCCDSDSVPQYVVIVGLLRGLDPTVITVSHTAGHVEYAIARPEP